MAKDPSTSFIDAVKAMHEKLNRATGSPGGAPPKQPDPIKTIKTFPQVLYPKTGK